MGRLDKISKNENGFTNNALLNVSKGISAEKIALNKLVKAPDEWNFYSELPPSKMAELLESISTIGLQHPIVVWEQPNNTYMILSGHNRSKAYELLRDNDNKDKYNEIPAVIKRMNEITEEEAQEIIIDTNWVQRELTPIQKAKSISIKYTKLKTETRNKKIKLNINELIANEYNVTDRQLLSYKSLLKLIGPLQELIDTVKLSIKAGVKLSKFSPDIQQIIFESYDPSIINKKYSFLSSTMTIEEIKNLFDDTKAENISLKISLPKNNKEDFLRELELLKSKYSLEF